MGLWSAGMKKTEIDNAVKMSKDLEYFLEMQTAVKSFNVRDAQSAIVDIEGSVELYPSMLRDGKLAFKIGRVSGDFICHCTQFHPSVLPEETGGNIVFRNYLIGNTSFRYRFNLGNTVHYIYKNCPTHGTVKEITISSHYNEDMAIETEVIYKIGYQALEFKEQDVFISGKEMQELLDSQFGSNVPYDNGHSIDTKYPVGYEAWFLYNNRPSHQFISGIEIKIVEGEVLNVTTTYMVKIDGESVKLLETDIYDSKTALLVAID